MIQDSQDLRIVSALVAINLNKLREGGEGEEEVLWKGEEREEGEGRAGKNLV